MCRFVVRQETHHPIHSPIEIGAHKVVINYGLKPVAWSTAFFSVPRPSSHAPFQVVADAVMSACLSRRKQ